MKKDEKILNTMKKLRKLGLGRTTILSLTVLVMLSNVSAMEQNNDSKKEAITKEEKTNTYSYFASPSPNTSSIESILSFDPEETLKPVETKEPTTEEKIAVILERENMTREQLDVIIATVKGEAAADSYDDAYAVINTFYNRTISKTWINEMIRATGNDVGDNLYAQITLDNQSEVYTEGTYQLYLGTTEGPIYDAVIDFLYTLDRKHDYLCFYASYGNIPDSVQFAENGNWYYSLMPEDDIVVEDDLVLKRTND